MGITRIAWGGCIAITLSVVTADAQFALPPDPLKLETRLRYDALGRLVELQDGRGGRTAFAYDGGAGLTRVTDPRGLVTQYLRNGFGQVEAVISPDTGREDRSYDASGNLKTRIDGRGVRATYGYDAVDRLTSAVFTQDGRPSETLGWVYGETGPEFPYGIGRLTSSTHPEGARQFAYNTWGEVVKDTQRVGTLGLAAGYQYMFGDLTGVTYPSGHQLDLTVDRGRIRALALDGRPLVTQVEWTPFGGSPKRWRWAMASGEVVHERHWDLAGRMIRHPLGPVLRDLRYDAANRIVSFTHLKPDGTPQPAWDQAFTYDENDRITGIGTATATWAIRYDPVGNRTGESLNGRPRAWVTEATSNRLVAATEPARRFEHDSGGNTVRDSGGEGVGYAATYNLRGQLETITARGDTTTYAYNAFGQRVRKESSMGPQSTVVFMYDTEGHLLGEYDLQGRAIREYIWLRDMPIAMFMPDPADLTGAAQVYYIHTDHLDTPRIVVDREGRQRWRWLSEPFGTGAPETDPEGLGHFTQNLRFPGQYADAESGLFYNWHRYYGPGGRYTQPDPIGLGGGVNAYSYVVGNPLSYADPLGLFVTATYNHATGMLYAYDSDTGKLYSGPFESGGKPWGDPIPNGDYDILSDRRVDFFRLEPVDSSYGDDQTASGRREFRLHKPGRTMGCVSSTDAENWKSIRDAIRGSSGDSVDVLSKSRNPFNRNALESLYRYGRLTVINSPK